MAMSADEAHARLAERRAEYDARIAESNWAGRIWIEAVDFVKMLAAIAFLVGVVAVPTALVVWFVFHSWRALFAIGVVLVIGFGISQQKGRRS